MVPQLRMAPWLTTTEAALARHPISTRTIPATKITKTLFNGFPRTNAMVAANRSKSADKQDVCRKMTSLLKKAYVATAPKQELPVLETLLYAVCLENAAPEQAGAVYARLLNAFHDLNEVRVSSISELKPVFEVLGDADWRAARVK